MGFMRSLPTSLTNAAYEKHQLSFPGKTIEILNKLSEEQGVLRQTMLFTGLEVCAHNINRKQKDLKLFEFGKIYWKKTRPKTIVANFRMEIFLVTTGKRNALPFT